MGLLVPICIIRLAWRCSAIPVFGASISPFPTAFASFGDKFFPPAFLPMKLLHWIFPNRRRNWPPIDPNQNRFRIVNLLSSEFETLQNIFDRFVECILGARKCAIRLCRPFSYRRRSTCSLLTNLLIVPLGFVPANDFILWVPLCKKKIVLLSYN